MSPEDLSRASSAVQSPASASVTALLVQPRAAQKVIKGEIHNVLTVMRADQRYVSQHRFTEESDVETHPVAQQLQALHAQLTAMPSDVPPDALLYLPVFCRAVTSRDITAVVTGAALSALHKFLLYGFLLPDSPNAQRAMTSIAQALLHCTFEESDDRPTLHNHIQHTNTLSSSTSVNLSSASSSTHRRQQHNRTEDERVVLKLLELSALVVRCSLQGTNLLEPECVVGLLDTCLHVSHRAHRASPLLKSAAADSLAQIVLQVFAGTGQPVVTARLQILAKLASLLNPNEHQEEVIVSSLTAVNIALETCREELSQREIEILQNDLCKYLLQWSTSRNLRILSLTLRVIFNLFQTIRNHLKVPLEVFLTSVHLRILDSSKSTPEEREVALESLLEFCQEPALLQDLYLNYDCDVACTNLYESIVATLGRVALPAGHNDEPPPVSSSSTTTATKAVNGTVDTNRNPSTTVLPTLVPVRINHLNRLAVQGILAILDSIAKRTDSTSSSTDEATEDTDSVADSQISDQELLERRQRKNALSKMALAFNENPMGATWLEVARQQQVIDSIDDAEAAAKLLYTATEIDKAKLGDYLSKGPETKFPFQAAVRQHFVALYDFKSLSFAGALRRFLSKFRLPGEAQCIDRLMEAFSKELFYQQEESSTFKNSDSVYVLAFSTIMLNTDLHNPTIKSDKRMTAEQFIRNNRGINDGDDMPADFLKELYYQIKEKEIQVQRELGELFMKKHENEDFRTTWESMLSKNREVATPFFTPVGSVPRNVTRAGVHDKEMFVQLSKYAMECLPVVFKKSWDDTLVVRVLQGLRQMVRVAAYFDLDSVVDEILMVLLPFGREYITSCIIDDRTNMDAGASVVSNSRNTVASGESVDDDDQSEVETQQPVPFGMLSSSDDNDEIDITGSAAHRGLLALDAGLMIVRRHTRRISQAWPAYVECICALKDAKALPTGISDLDDFADSNGNVLPPSTYARSSQRRLDGYYRDFNDRDANQPKTWFGRFFDKNKKKTSRDEQDSYEGDEDSVTPSKLPAYSRMFLDIAEAADVEGVLQSGASKLSSVANTIRALLNTVNDYPYNDDPIREQYAIFSLEMSARALLSNRDQASEFFTMFLDVFERMLGCVTDKEVPSPFVIERVVVTVLRANIHLYDLEELRPNLRASLHLLIMSLPRNFMRNIADRMSCGLAIILRSYYQYFEGPNEWGFMTDTLDMLANEYSARVFVFDGVASTVEYAIPNKETTEKGHNNNTESGERPPLSKDACQSLSKLLIRFVLGFYQSDLSLSIPAMMCLEKVYRHGVENILKSQAARNGTEISPDAVKTQVPDQESWQNVTVAVYSLCRSPDPDVSRHGVECFRRLILPTSIDQIPDEKWMSILYLMVHKQPPLAASASRGNVFGLVGDMLQYLVPVLSHKTNYRDDLVDLVTHTASLAHDNLRQGRRNGNSVLFEATVEAVTAVSNSMLAEDYKGESEFSSWASDTLLAELEKMGAAGASIKNQKAVQASTMPVPEEVTEKQ